MSTSIRQHGDDIENLLDYLLAQGLAIYRRPSQRTATFVGWIPSRPGRRFLGQRAQHSVELYQDWVETGHYNAILFDGSLLQLSYEAAGRVLTKHRLAYVPCPAIVDWELLTVFPVLDVVDDALSAGFDSLNLATVVRFDFDLESAEPGHPAAHLSMNTADCRIPCITPVRLGRFVQFVFSHFYPDVWRNHRYLRNIPVSEMGGRTVTHEEAAGTHLAWAV